MTQAPKGRQCATVRHCRPFGALQIGGRLFRGLTAPAKDWRPFGAPIHVHSGAQRTRTSDRRTVYLCVGSSCGAAGVPAVFRTASVMLVLSLISLIRQ